MIMKEAEKDVIIIADNERAWFDAINLYLESELESKYKTIYASNSKELFEKTLIEKPNLILTDSLYKPDNTEFISKFLRTAKENHTQILLFTRSSILAYQLGAIASIEKPFCPSDINFNELSKTIEKYILKSKNERLEEENQKLREKLKYDVRPIITESLKNWMKRYPDTNQKIISDGSREYSVNELIEEIDKGSELGNRLLTSWITLKFRVDF